MPGMWHSLKSYYRPRRLDKGEGESEQEPQEPRPRRDPAAIIKLKKKKTIKEKMYLNFLPTAPPTGQEGLAEAVYREGVSVSLCNKTLE